MSVTCVVEELEYRWGRTSHIPRTGDETGDEAREGYAAVDFSYL